MVGRTSRCGQCHQSIDDGPGIKLFRKWQVVGTLGGQARYLLRGITGQGIPEWGSRIYEGRARKLQSHGLQQHLVGVGGAIKGAGAGTVVRGALRPQQLFTAGLALSKTLSNTGFFFVR